MSFNSKTMGIKLARMTMMKKASKPVEWTKRSSFSRGGARRKGVAAGRPIVEICEVVEAGTMFELGAL